MTVGRWSGRSGIGKEEREAEFLKDADEIPSSGRRGGADGDEQEAASVSFFGRASTSEPGSPPPQRTSAPVAQDDEEDSFLLQPRQHPTNGASSPLLDHLRYQLSTQHSTTQLVLAQNETLALRVESLEVQQGEALSSLGPLKSRLAELEAKESRWETSLAKEKVALEADRETMRRAVKEWEEGRKREKEEREERRLNEALGVGGEKRVDPPTATLRPDHNDHNPTFKLRASSSPSLIRSPSRPRRAPVPSVFKTPLVRSLSSEGTLRPTTSPLAASSATLEGPPSTLPLPLKDLDEPVRPSCSLLLFVLDISLTFLPLCFSLRFARAEPPHPYYLPRSRHRSGRRSLPLVGRGGTGGKVAFVLVLIGVRPPLASASSFESSPLAFS